MTIDIELKDSNLDKSIRPRSMRGKKKMDLDPITKRKRKKRALIITILSIFLVAIGFLIYKGYLFSHEFGFRLEPGSLLLKENKSLMKDSSGNYTNILLVGLDTRENGGLLNTDTIIMASYNYTTNNITLVSIPRDFHVEVEEGMSWYVRINSIYSTAEQKKEGSGIVDLQKTVERITGQEIQYYAMVDFRAFVEIIDTIGGVDVNVENSFTDYRYPLGKGYQTVSFKAGPQTMDGETALIYSRSRHSLQNNEGSDFARAKRQQKVIVALKDKILSSESLGSPKTLISIISSIAGNIRLSEFTIKDIEAGFKLSSIFEESSGKVFSFVLDPSAGNNSIIEKKNMESGAYAIGPKLGFGKYEDIIDYTNLLLNKPGIYSEDARILVYDTGAGFQSTRDMTLILQEEFPYTNILFVGTLRSDLEEIVVYSHEEGENTFTVFQLSEYLKTAITEKPDYISTNLNGEDVTILVGSNLELKEN
jgi:LCP family protein required for cell wall assembly